MVILAQSQPAVSRCIAEVTAHLLNVWIKFPNSNEERERIKRGFYELASTFANVAGVVDDDTHQNCDSTCRTLIIFRTRILLQKRIFFHKYQNNL
jgi:hypothetical protein